MKEKKYHTVLKYHSKFIERDKIDTLNIQIEDRSFSRLGTDISIKSDGVKQVLWVQTSRLSETMRSCMCFRKLYDIS